VRSPRSLLPACPQLWDLRYDGCHRRLNAVCSRAYGPRSAAYVHGKFLVSVVYLNILQNHSGYGSSCRRGKNDMMRTVSTGVLQLLPDGGSGSALSMLTSVRQQRSAASQPETLDSPGVGSAAPTSIVAPGPAACAAVKPSAALSTAHSGRVCRFNQGRQGVVAREGGGLCPQSSSDWLPPTGIWPSLLRSSSGSLPSGVLRWGARSQEAGSVPTPSSQFFIESLRRKCAALPVSARCHFLSLGRKASATASLQPDRQRRFPYVS